IGPAVMARALALQIPIVERQQIFLMELDQREIALRREGRRCARDEELLWSLCLLIAQDVSGAVEIHLRPDADREERHLDLVESLDRAALFPPIVIEWVLLHIEEDVMRQGAGVIAIGRVKVRNANA